METMQTNESSIPHANPSNLIQRGNRCLLPAKGSCWYCEKPLDSVRRFCGKACADGFDDEQAFADAQSH